MKPTMEQIQSICATDHVHSAWLKAPFSRTVNGKRWVIGSNGHIAVFVHSAGGDDGVKDGTVSRFGEPLDDHILKDKYGPVVSRAKLLAWTDGIPADIVCPKCEGAVDPASDCSECDGSGVYECDYGEDHDCRECDGSGKVDGCLDCDDTGRVRTPYHQTVGRLTRTVAVDRLILRKLLNATSESVSSLMVRTTGSVDPILISDPDDPEWFGVIMPMRHDFPEDSPPPFIQGETP